MKLMFAKSATTWFFCPGLEPVVEIALARIGIAVGRVIVGLLLLLPGFLCLVGLVLLDALDRQTGRGDAGANCRPDLRVVATFFPFFFLVLFLVRSAGLATFSSLLEHVFFSTVTFVGALLCFALL